MPAVPGRGFQSKARACSAAPWRLPGAVRRGGTGCERFCKGVRLALAAGAHALWGSSNASDRSLDRALGGNPPNTACHALSHVFSLGLRPQESPS